MSKCKPSWSSGTPVSPVWVGIAAAIAGPINAHQQQVKLFQDIQICSTHLQPAAKVSWHAALGLLAQQGRYVEQPALGLLVIVTLISEVLAGW